MNTLTDANLSCLKQGISFLKQLSPEICASKCDQVFGSSIGGHFRHNIDHYLAFRDGLDAGQVDYDARARNIRIEQEPTVAVEVMEDLVLFFENIKDIDLDREIRVRMDDGGESVWSRSSIRRELQFLLSHTIHHYALVVSIATRHGLKEFPPGFGVAPSTTHYREKLGA